MRTAIPCRFGVARATTLWPRLAMLLLFVPALAFAQANGKLQIHHMKVGQGDGMLLISPQGQTVLFDDGVYTNCTYIKSYLQGLGITTVDYHFASHYHADHIGCIDDLAAIGITIGTAGYDRGYSYSSATYTAYVNTLGSKRRTIAKGQVIALDTGAANPVTITCVDLNGAGVYSPTGGDENAVSVVLKVSYGSFDEVIGGDLTGTSGSDVESTVGPEVGDVEVYKVHHHGSLYSTNDSWLSSTTPEVAVIQVGNNSYGHPTAEALDRLHAHGVHAYWTELGSGASPDPQWDRVANETVLVEADPGSDQGYTVSGPGFSDSYPNGGGSPPPPPVSETVVASAVSLLSGTITGGSAASLGQDDGSDLAIAAVKSGKKWLTDWYGSIFLQHTPIDLTLTYDGAYSATRTQVLSVWNWSTSAWVQVSSSTVGTTDITRTWTTTSPASYVSASNEVRLRVAGGLNRTAYNCYGDYMSATYEYQPAVVVPIQVARYAGAAEHPAAPAPEAAILPLAVLTRVDSRAGSEGVEIAWATDRDAHADGFNVYRQEANGTRTCLGGETELVVEEDEVRFRFVDRTVVAGTSSYWLGVRGCAGPEALIGPIEAAAKAALPVALQVWPNPSHDRSTFEFALVERGKVALDVFDVAGRRVAHVFDGELGEGRHTVDWDARTDEGVPVGAGVYFAKLTTARQTGLRRIVLVGE